MKELGLLQVYTGDGKGKTTAALGLALRASGHGFRVCMIQFMKKSELYGEAKLDELLPKFTLLQVGRNDFVNLNAPEQIDIDLARSGWEKAKEIIKSDSFDMVILDEVNVALSCGLLACDKVCAFLNEEWRIMPSRPELICTGRYAPQQICDLADLVTEMREIRHHYGDNQTAARCGSEY